MFWKERAKRSKKSRQSDSPRVIEAAELTRDHRVIYTAGTRYYPSAVITRGPVHAGEWVIVDLESPGGEEEPVWEHSPLVRRETVSLNMKERVMVRMVVE